MLNNKFWQAFFALAPIIGFFLIFIGYAVFLMSIFGNVEEMDRGGGPPWPFFKGLGFFFFMIFLVVVISVGSLIFYIIHATKNPNLKHDNLLLVWILLFIFASGIGQMIYWIVEILAKKDPPVT